MLSAAMLVSSLYETYIIGTDHDMFEHQVRAQTYRRDNHPARYGSAHLRVLVIWKLSYAHWRPNSMNLLFPFLLCFFVMLAAHSAVKRLKDGGFSSILAFYFFGVSHEFTKGETQRRCFLLCYNIFCRVGAHVGQSDYHVLGMFLFRFVVLTAWLPSYVYWN